MAETRNKYAVVTGGNKGLGFEICRQLLSHGITVVLTGRDEKRGVEAVEKLKASSAGISDSTATLLFHQLDVTSSSSTASLVDFIKSRFGKLDILVNNVGIGGFVVDVHALKATDEASGQRDLQTGATNNIKLNEISTETYELAVECIETNYYGVKRTTEALLPLLDRSDSPRIVNVSSQMGMLKNIPNEWAKETLNDAKNLREDKIDEVLSEFLKDFKEGSHRAKGWPQYGAYTFSKAAVNAYTRVLAKKRKGFRINSVCPGFVKTDINYNTGFLTVEEGAESPVRLALLPDNGPSGLFFVRKEVSSFVG